MYKTEGRVTEIFDTQSGVGKNGKEWFKRQVVIETETRYPTLIAFTAWGDLCDQAYFKIGAKIEVSFDVSSREYQGKYYSDIKAIGFKPLESGRNPADTSSEADSLEPQVADSQIDDLPF
jgi:hypothetical protein